MEKISEKPLDEQHPQLYVRVLSYDMLVWLKVRLHRCLKWVKLWCERTLNEFPGVTCGNTVSWMYTVYNICNITPAPNYTCCSSIKIKLNQRFLGFKEYTFDFFGGKKCKKLCDQISCRCICRGVHCRHSLFTVRLA